MTGRTLVKVLERALSHVYLGTLFHVGGGCYSGPGVLPIGLELEEFRDL